MRSSLTEEVEIPFYPLEDWDGEGADELVDLLDEREKRD